jgi:soluble lytic murein transglycosylase
MSNASTTFRAAYWLARAAEATGDAASQETWLKRAALYPVTYYGQLATLTLPAATRPEAVLPALPQAMPRNDLHRMARIMTALGRDDQLRHFIRRAADVAETPEEHRAASRLAIELGRPDLAVSASKRSAQRAGVMLPDEGWPVIDVPREPVLETALVLATIRQESAFEADAVSPAGARGLMQLMPKTARSVAAELGIAKTHRVEKLTRDPDYNMRLGKQYLAGLVSDYGSYLIALSAYNAGPGRASQWIRENGDPRGGTVDPIDWVELIGIAETRNYVQRVMENLQVYRSKTDRTAWLVAMERDFARSRR